MKCNKCGYDNEDNAIFCAYCGGDLSAKKNFFAEKVLNFLNDKLFLVMCILYTVSVGIGFINSRVNVIGILVSVFLWLAYSSGQKRDTGSRHIRCLSGAIFANYVLLWVVVGLVALSGVALTVVASVFNISGILDNIIDSLQPFGVYMGDTAEILGAFTDAIIMIVGVVLVVAAICLILFNVFGMRSLHKFVQSVYRSLDSGEEKVLKAGAAKSWLIVFGIFSAISALSSLITNSLFYTAIAADGCKAASMFIGSILIGKYFSEQA